MPLGCPPGRRFGWTVDRYVDSVIVYRLEYRHDDRLLFRDGSPPSPVTVSFFREPARTYGSPFFHLVSRYLAADVRKPSLLNRFAILSPFYQIGNKNYMIFFLTRWICRAVAITAQPHARAVNY